MDKDEYITQLQDKIDNYDVRLSCIRISREKLEARLAKYENVYFIKSKT